MKFIFLDENLNENNQLAQINRNPTFDNDPAKWICDDFHRNHVIKNGFIQNIDTNDFSNSKRMYNNNARYLSPCIFQRTMLNGEKTSRNWLIYSQSRGSIFRGPCLLFGKESSGFTLGFNDWKNAGNRVTEHENSKNHHNSILALKETGCKINNSVLANMDEEINYWRKVSHRVVTVIVSLTSRGLPLRGDNEKFGSVNNGDFLMSLEMLAKFDPFIAQHIERFGNKGSGSTSYLSKTVYEEFVQLMGKKVLQQIVTEIKKSKYYSIIVDSTPDISHADQLAFIIRYLQSDGTPKERFIKFIDNPGHKSEQLAEIVIDTLSSLDIDIKDCRGQSYDNARNMSGAYTGLQKRIKDINCYAEYAPCSAHSLNLVGKRAAESCNEAISYFSIIQNLFNFFTASTSRWKILDNKLSSNAMTLKSLSTTRWSARSDAVRSLDRSWLEIYEALDIIENDITEKSLTRNEAKGIKSQLEKLETAFMQCLWSFLLSRFDSISKKLQNKKTTIEEVISLYDGLVKIVENTKIEFDRYETKALELSENEEYKQTISRKKKKN